MGQKIVIDEIETSEGPRNYGFVKTNSGITIIDLGSIEDIPPFNTLILNGLKEFLIRNNLLYALLDSSFQIYDLSNILDDSISQLLKNIATTNKNYGLTISSKYIYLGQENGLAVVDVTDEMNPTLLAEYKDFEKDCDYNMQIGNGVIYEDVLISNGLSPCFQFFVFDISNPTEPTLIDLDQIYGGLEVQGFTLDKEYLYITYFPHPGGLRSFDISDPLNSQSVGVFNNNPKAAGASVKTRDNLVFYCGYMNTEGYPYNQQGGLFILKNDLITSITKSEDSPNKYYMSQNYPNPFNPTTVINYVIPQQSFVTLKVYDILGRDVATLVNEQKSAGNYETEFNADNLSSGIYFYRLEAGSFSDTKKLILLK